MYLENDFMRVEIAELGAEVTRVFDKKHACELLWEGDGAFWKRHSPVLFPNVGKTYQNKMLINGKIYPTSQHGFARDMEFECTKAEDEVAVFLLKSTEATLERYPFAFELEIEYRLEENVLKVIWRVHNPADEEMYFTIGAHPAFRFSRFGEKKCDHCLVFPGKDSLEYILIDPATASADPDNVHEIALENGALPLSEELFVNDALILDGAQVEEVWLCGADRAPLVGMRSIGFPNYGIWSVKDAPFVCLEPWMGRCDNSGFDEELSRKPWVNALKGGETFEKFYEILVPVE